MKKWCVFSFLFMLLLLTACSQNATEDGLLAYDTEEVSESLEYLTFPSQMPALLPFKPEKITRQQLTGIQTGKKNINLPIFIFIKIREDSLHQNLPLERLFIKIGMIVQIMLSNSMMERKRGSESIMKALKF
ncbi:hypothetical protein [Halobacillus halophilus]|uniref:hypothetical protein n=1 Tax=Halobacillus halophilus TaxID=1570 RepID=UPI001CD77503|nr:hypothetical protein [Halobacillus halophilus]MCA1011596.1 hypothetical protein [Halobacillus halophilus]